MLLDASSRCSEALAQLVVEAEAQSLERRGRFAIALGGGGELAAALGSVLRSHAESCNWADWHVFFVAESIGDGPSEGRA